jgi:hypothetical protein
VFAPPWHTRWTLGAAVSSILSAALGDVSHIVWDGFTHSDGLFVPHLPALARPYDLPIIGQTVVHRILQYASTVVGLAAIAAYLAWRIHRTPRIAIDVPRGRARIVFAVCIAAGVAAIEAQQQLVHLTALGTRIAAAISGILAGTVVASLIVRRAARRYHALVLDADRA